MRIFIITLSFLFSLFLFSCQKESNLSNNNGGNNGSSTGGTRLMKTVLKYGSDSVVTDYSYNSSGKIIGAKLSGSDGGQPIDYRLTYVRNSSGIIQKQILKSNDLIAAGIDSIVSIVNYDVGNNRYKNAVSVFSFLGLSVRDSIVLQYDGSGKYISEIDYEDGGLGYETVWKKEYTYSGNNLGSEKYYSYDDASSSFVLEETSAYQYDSKVNPLQFPGDAPVLNMNPFYSANNIAKEIYTDATDPSNNYVSNVTYVYNSSNKPKSSTEVVGADTYTTTYYYQ